MRVLLIFIFFPPGRNKEIVSTETLPLALVEKVVQPSLSIPQCYALWGHIQPYELQPSVHYSGVICKEMTDMASTGCRQAAGANGISHTLMLPIHC